MATVFIPAVLRRFTDGRDRLDVPGRTLRQVVQALEAACPGLGVQLLQDDEVRPGLAFVVDGEATSQGLIQPVGETSEVHILPAIGGGSLRDS